MKTFLYHYIHESGWDLNGQAFGAGVPCRPGHALMQHVLALQHAQQFGQILGLPAVQFF